MVSWLRALLPAVPVILDVAREVRRHREPAPLPPPAPLDAGLDLAAALARAEEALGRVSEDLAEVSARQAALERRLDVLAVAVWALGGVLAVVAIGLLVYLVRG